MAAESYHLDHCDEHEDCWKSWTVAEEDVVDDEGELLHPTGTIRVVVHHPSTVDPEVILNIDLHGLVEDHRPETPEGATLEWRLASREESALRPDVDDLLHAQTAAYGVARFLVDPADAEALVEVPAPAIQKAAHELLVGMGAYVDNQEHVDSLSLNRQLAEHPARRAEIRAAEILQAELRSQGRS